MCYNSSVNRSTCALLCYILCDIIFYKETQHIYDNKKMSHRSSKARAGLFSHQRVVTTATTGAVASENTPVTCSPATKAPPELIPPIPTDQKNHQPNGVKIEDYTDDRDSNDEDDDDDDEEADGGKNPMTEAQLKKRIQKQVEEIERRRNATLQHPLPASFERARAAQSSATLSTTATAPKKKTREEMTNSERLKQALLEKKVDRMVLTSDAKKEARRYAMVQEQERKKGITPALNTTAPSQTTVQADIASKCTLQSGKNNVGYDSGSDDGGDSEGSVTEENRGLKNENRYGNGQAYDPLMTKSRHRDDAEKITDDDDDDDDSGDDDATSDSDGNGDNDNSKPLPPAVGISHESERPSHVFGPNEWRADDKFDDPDAEFIIVMPSHVEVTPRAPEAAIMLGAGYMDTVREKELIPEDFGSASDSDSSDDDATNHKQPKPKPKSKTSATPCLPGLDAMLCHASLTREPRITVGFARKYEPYLITRKGEHLGKEGREYRRKKIQEVIMKNAEEDAKRDQDFQDRVVKDSNVANTEPITNAEDKSTRTHDQTPPVTTGKTQGRPTKTPATKKSHKKKKASGPEAARLSAYRKAWSNSKAEAAASSVHDTNQKMKAVDDFPYPERLKVANQKFAAVIFIPDNTKEAKEEKEPVMVWLRNFNSIDEFVQWMEAGAKDMLRNFEVECVDLYERLWPVKRARDIERGMPAENGNGNALSHRKVKYGDEELNTIMNEHDRQTKKASAFHRKHEAEKTKKNKGSPATFATAATTSSNNTTVEDAGEQQK